MVRLIEIPEPSLPKTISDLTVRPAEQGEAALVRAIIARHHSLLPQPPAIWQVAFLLLDKKGNVWGAATWNHPTARLEDQKHTLELTRYALASGLPKNTATWALARMRAWIRENMPGIHRLISYHDEAVHTGTIYTADNWKRVYRSQIETSPWSNRPGRTATPRPVKSKWERQP